MSTSGDFATLGLRLDAQGMIAPANQAAASLFGVGAAAQGVQSKVREFSTTAAVSLGQLSTSGAKDIGSLLRQLNGLGFALGPIAGTIGLAVTGIGTAWFEARKEAQRAQGLMLKDAEDFGRQLATLQRLQRQQQLGPLGETGSAVQAGRARLAVLGSEIGDLSGAVSRGEFIGPIKSARLKAIAQEYTMIALAVQAGEREITRIQAEAAKERKREEDRLAAERLARFKRDIELQAQQGEMRTLGLPNASEARQFIAGLEAKLRASAIGSTAGFGLLGAERQFEMKMALDAWVDALNEGAKAAERAAKIEAERVEAMKEYALLDVTRNALGHVDRALGTGGVFSGVSAGFGRVEGGKFDGKFGITDPYAIGAAVVNEFLTGIFDMFGGNEAEEARRFAEHLGSIHKETERLNADLAVLQGRMSRADAEMLAVNRQYADRIEELRAGIAALSGSPLGRGIVEKWEAELAALNATMQGHRDLIAAQVAEYNKALTEDLQVRMLRAHGMDEQAEALELMLRQERELAQARRDGISATNEAMLIEVQRIERINAQMAKHQQMIDSLTGTIGGLTGFRDSLLLSETKSPTDRLAEARRQYDAIFAAAQGDDIKKAQEAAGRLPGAANILLDASRAVNASGLGYQTDFAKVLADSQALIDRFNDLKSIEELMLDELRQIRDNTKHIGRDDVTKPVGTLPADDGGTGGKPTPTTDEGAITVLQEGFALLLGEVRDLRTELTANTLETRRGFESIGSGNWGSNGGLLS